jgi:hypothetical protein
LERAGEITSNRQCSNMTEEEQAEELEDEMSLEDMITENY